MLHLKTDFKLKTFELEIFLSGIYLILNFKNIILVCKQPVVALNHYKIF